METVLLACIFAAFALTVAGAPMYTDSEETGLRQYSEEYPYLREARSQYAPQYVPAPHYITPCAAADAAAAAGYAAPYHLNLPAYAMPHYESQYHGAPHYRSVEEHVAEPEMLAFSDMDQLQHSMMMDHVPMARTAYGGPISSLNPGLALNGPVLTSAGGPAYGIFPNANVGGCNVPLLFSCSPSISSGRMMEPQSHISSVVAPVATGNTYRLVEQPLHHDVHEQSDESQEHLEPVHQTSHVQSHR